MQDFKNLKVWERAHRLTVSVYQVTRFFPKEELYGLTSQMRRASASIGANIAEECGRRGNPELLRFLQIAMGSASELEYHLLLARDLNLLEQSAHKNVSHEATEVKRMLASLMSKLRAMH
jgi:four helix bundle protein